MPVVARIPIAVLLSIGCSAAPPHGSPAVESGTLPGSESSGTTTDGLPGGSSTGVSAPPDAGVAEDSSAGIDTDAGDDTGQPVPAVPGGRHNYVVALMGARFNAAWVRLATWEFAEDGTVAEHYWYWDQTQAPVDTNPYANRISTGYTTAGCPKECDIWTTTTFEPGAPPPFDRSGEWHLDELGNVAITWSTGFHESYAIIDHGTHAQLTLAEHEYADVSEVHASVYGSNAPIDLGVDIATIAGSLALDFTSHMQNWDEVTAHQEGTIWWQQYFLCGDDPCLQGMHPEGYHTYFTNRPEVDGRKTYWYHQLAEVAQGTECANVERGGHTYQLLQILDDAGEFVGFVGAETSLLGQRTGGSIITHFTALLQR